MTADADHPETRIPGLAITYPPDLPVSQRRDDIAAAIAAHQIVIVAGETGSGKTTQLPKILLELGRESIAHTQPRRIAARTIAERVAEELGSELGGLVGYRVRFTDQVSAGTRVTLMTVKPGRAGENSRSVNDPLDAPGLSTAFTWALSPS